MSESFEEKMSRFKELTENNQSELIREALDLIAVLETTNIELKADVRRMQQERDELRSGVAVLQQSEALLRAERDLALKNGAQACERAERAEEERTTYKAAALRAVELSEQHAAEAVEWQLKAEALQSSIDNAALKIQEMNGRIKELQQERTTYKEAAEMWVAAHDRVAGERDAMRAVVEAARALSRLSTEDYFLRGWSKEGKAIDEALKALDALSAREEQGAKGEVPKEREIKYTDEEMEG